MSKIIADNLALTTPADAVLGFAGQDPILEREQVLLDMLRAPASEGGAANDPDRFIFLFVCLKSRPIAILFGKENSGKQAAVDRMLAVLAGLDGQGTTYLHGHAWWASGSSNQALMVESQRRFNIDKLEGIFTEALLPESRGRLQLAFLSRVSPAEFVDLLVPLAFQWRNRRLIRLDSLHLPRPRPFPSNLLILATMDQEQLPIPDTRSLAGFSILNWAPFTCPPAPSPNGFRSRVSPERVTNPTLLTHRLTSVSAALRRIHAHRAAYARALHRLFSVLQSLEADRVPGLEALRVNALLDLANSLDSRGNGLFRPDFETNNLVSLDLHLSLSLLPIALAQCSITRTTRRRLATILDVNSPRAKRYLAQLG